MKKKLSFKKKLMISVILMSLIPLALSSYYALKSSREELKRQATQKLILVRDAKNSSLTRYLNTVSSQLLSSSNSKMIADAAKDFIAAFNEISTTPPDALTNLNKYYQKDFAEEYKKKTGKENPLENIAKTLPLQSLALQNAFISSNPNPLGSKHLLTESPLVPDYSAFHKLYHPSIKNFLETFSLYDIFIVDIETGNVVYTVYKELDFSTNLLNGPYKETDLAIAFSEAAKINDQNTFKITDFKKYSPSYEAPASFIAAPIWSGNKKIAVLIFQMPLGIINEIMNERSGMGKTGESYLVGSDHKLRSDTHNDSEMNIYNSFNKDKLIKSPNVMKAINGDSGVEVTTNYKNDEVLSSFTKINYPHLNWVIFTEGAISEVFEAANITLRNILIFIIILSVIVILSALATSNTLIKQVETIVELFSSTAHDVQNSSQKMNIISSNLNTSVQTQISSITESAAAMDEITAMLKNNTSSSEHASRLSSNSKDSANKGKAQATQMLAEVKEIAKSYDEIQLSLDKNNEDIGQIVNVISEIAKKTEVINEIVFQTKLLSFNASVEAARAGESGKGFAVVAEEIANLASMSGKAASDIKDMLTQSQTQVQQLAGVTKDRIGKIVTIGREKIEIGNHSAALCIEQLDNILATIVSLDSSITEINSAIREQSTGIEEVNIAMKTLENATHETTDMSERSKLSSEDLKIQSHKLRESIQELRAILGAKSHFNRMNVSENDIHSEA